jgi:citrate lyase beta subunit
MLKSFFFIPANKSKFISKVDELNSSFFVFDLEDAILNTEIESSLDNLSKVIIKDNYFVRFGFFNELLELNKALFSQLLSLGFIRFVIPKFYKKDQLVSIRNFLLEEKMELNEFEFILLIESPLGLLNIAESLQCKNLRISGIGLGSHDYASEMRMKHTDYNLYYARQIILNTAKAYKIDALDTVCVNINNDSEFIHETKQSFDMGFDGKFLIHPKQIELLDEIEFYSLEEIHEAEKVYNKILEIKNRKKSILEIDGKIYEKPHINRIVSIIYWKEKRYGSK